MRDQLVVAPSQPAVGTFLLQLQGELDGLTLPRPRKALTDAVDAAAAELARPRSRGGPSSGHVVCDLDGLDFVSASGLGMLVEIAEHAHTRDTAFVLIASCRPARRVLELTGLDHFFVTAPNVNTILGATRALTGDTITT